MGKIEVILNYQKIQKLVTPREYTNKQGEKVQLQEVKFELIPIKEQKTVISGDWGRKVKTHFAAEIQSKEDKEGGKQTNFIGSAYTFYFADKNKARF